MNKLNFKIGDVVVNIISKELVGQYIEQYDVRILPEMIAENCDSKYAEIMYIDDDGAIITKEFGQYAFPGNGLRLATKEEILEHEIDKYTVKIPLRGEDYTLPLELSRKLIKDERIVFGKNNTGHVETLANYLRINWSSFNSDKLTRLALIKEATRVFKERVKTGKGSDYYHNLAHKIVTEKDKEAIALFEELIFKNPVESKQIYDYIERNSYIIPKEYAVLIREVNGYCGGALIEGMDLYVYLKENNRYNGNFQHYDKLQVTKEGIDLLYSLCWGSSEMRRIVEKLTMDVEMIKYFLSNPSRSFTVETSPWFRKLPWEEIIENKQLFAGDLKSHWDLVYRIQKGGYVSPEYMVKVFDYDSAAKELMCNETKSNKESLKLKEMVAYLEKLKPEEVKAIDGQKTEVRLAEGPLEGIIFEPAPISYNSI